MPFPPTEQDLTNEYTKNNVGVTGELVDNMQKIARTLTDTKLMKSACKLLSDDILETYQRNIGNASTANDLKKAMVLADRKEDDPSRHLLTTVLTEFESGNGFKTFQSVNGHPRIIQMTGLVSGPGFLSTVGVGHMAKDYVTIEHGVYTHRIQWYCLYKLQKAGKINITSSWGDLFRSFQVGMAWLITFDRLPEHEEKATGSRTIEVFDFRTPEKLHAYLKSGDAASECPLLATYMQSKANEIKHITNWMTIKKITAARKLFPAKKTSLDGWKKLKNATAVDQLLKSVLSKEELAELGKVVVLKATTDDANLLTPQGAAYRAGGPA